MGVILVFVSFFLWTYINLTRTTVQDSHFFSILTIVAVRKKSKRGFSVLVEFLKILYWWKMYLPLLVLSLSVWGGLCVVVGGGAGFAVWSFLALSLRCLVLPCPVLLCLVVSCRVVS